MKIKVISLNVWAGGKLMEPMLEFLKAENPDILSLQEVYNGTGNIDKKLRTVEIVKEAANLSYTSFSPAFMDLGQEARVERGNAVLSRFPITSAQTIYFDIPYGELDERGMTDFTYVPRNLQHCTLEVAGKTVDVFNIHGIWGFDGQDNERRLEMSETIVKEVKDKELVILSGDFNVRDKTKTINMIEEHLQNVFKDELQTTFNMRQKKDGGFGESVVDHLLVSKNITVGKHSCPDVNVSDHLPLIAYLDIPVS